MKTGSLSKPRRLRAFFASPRADGYTNKLLTAFLEALPAHSFAVEIADVYISPVAPCTHCGYCERAVGCSLPDMDGLYADIEGADALVFASPVYNLGFPAPMKAVIDRFQRYYAARFSLGQTLPIAHPKQAVLLSVSGGGDRAGHQYMEMALARQFTVMNTVLAGAVHWPDTDRGGELPEKIRRELAALAATLAKKD